ncbi:YncE family protein [Pseudomonas sp. MAFF 301449]|uniref:YncE family protein n=1 Tax=Pseudomonas cyclaminis TaxID=2781239 RepID=A0ABR9SWC5_9PSED|nr:YncE family protein [Pseudomonas cyclaminis]
MITPTLTRLNPEHVLPPRPEVVTIRVSYSPMLPSDQIKVHIIGAAGLGTPDIPSKPGIPEPGENYVSFTVANYFVGANLGMNCQVFYDVLRDHASTTSTELTLQVQDLPAQELDLVRIPEAVGDQVETHKAYTVRVDGWSFMRPGQAMWIDLLSSSNYALRISLPVSNEEFNARRISMPIPATYLRSLHEGDTLRVKVLASLDGTGNKSSARSLEISPPYSVKRASGVIIGTIAVGKQPVHLALNKDNTRLYVGNVGSMTMSVIDTESLSVAHTINLDAAPSGVAVHPSGELVYVIFTHTIKVIETKSYQTVKIISIYPYGSALCLNPSGSRLFSLYNQAWSSGYNTIDTLTDTYISRHEIAIVYALTINPLGNRLYITGPNTTIAIDLATNTVLSRYNNPATTQGIAYNAHDDSLYVAATGNTATAGNVNILDARTNTLTLIKTISGFNRPWWVAINPVSPRAYVTENSGNTVKVINTSSQEIIATLAPFDQPKEIVVTSDGRQAFVANAGGDTITVFDT